MVLENEMKKYLIVFTPIALMVLLLAGIIIPQTVYNIPANDMNFDRDIGAAPPNCNINIAAGTNLTMGSITWAPKSGQIIKGAGRDKTILQFAPTTVKSGRLNRADVIRSTAGNVTIEDLTCDANYQRGTFTSLNGVSLAGSNNIIRNVRFTGGASFTTSSTNPIEGWGIFCCSAPYAESHGNLIEGCVVDGYACNFPNNNLSALGMLENCSGITRNNYVEQDGSTNYVLAYYVGSHDSDFEFNTCNHCLVGLHYDDGTCITNAIIVSNRFLDCGSAIDWSYAYVVGTIIEHNIMQCHSTPILLPNSTLVNVLTNNNLIY